MGSENLTSSQALLPLALGPHLEKPDLPQLLSTVAGRLNHLRQRADQMPIPDVHWTL